MDEGTREHVIATKQLLKMGVQMKLPRTPDTLVGKYS